MLGCAALSPVPHEPAHLDLAPLAPEFALELLRQLERVLGRSVLAPVVDDQDLIASSLDLSCVRRGRVARGRQWALLEVLHRGAEHDGEALALVVCRDDDGQLQGGILVCWIGEERKRERG